MLTLKTKGGQLDFGPGNTIEGVAGWQLDETPDSAQLFLMWYTVGKGDEDAAIAGELSFDTKESNQEIPFSFQLQESPYSFEGKLIALQWCLEVVTKDPDEVMRIDIMVSPWVKQVVLDKGGDD